MVANKPQTSSAYTEEAYGLFLFKINYFSLFNKYIKSTDVVALWLLPACLPWGTETDAFT